MSQYEELKTWIIVKLFRNSYVGHRLLDFDDFGKKVDKKSLLKALKELIREDIVLMKPSNRSAKGRFSLNLKTKGRWEERVLREIRKGLE